MSDDMRAHVQRCREIIADYNLHRDIPESEFPGVKSMYLVNLKAVLGNHVPALCDHIDTLLERVTELEQDGDA